MKTQESTYILYQQQKAPVTNSYNTVHRVLVTKVSGAIQKYINNNFLTKNEETSEKNVV